MQLKNFIDMPCGLRFMLDKLSLQSGFARRWLLDSSIMTTAEDITTTYEVLHRFFDFINSVAPTHINTLQFKLQNVKDIRTTIKNLKQRAVLDDIELFEIKHLAILSTDIAKLLKEHGLEDVVEIPSLDEVIDILDPDGMKISTFYIYDSYCEQLKVLRNKMRKHPELQDQLLIESSKLEEGIRKDLSDKLHPLATAIEQALISLAYVDINLAKAMQMQELGLCFPALAEDGECHYNQMFHPQVKEALENRGRNFQPVDICFGLHPTLITGANMGGKTVVLKTLALCQLLFQFGFGIPASQAKISLREEIYFTIGDEQSIEKGLSSFAAEMKNIDAIIKASRKERKILALIDEPARTTNPTEGAALVQSLLKVLNVTDMSLVMTTHYDIEPGEAHCLRVKGFANGSMDYSLVEVEDGEVPHEALNIAESLSIDPEWLDAARKLLIHPGQA